jgi:hypothetical protein
MVNVSVKNYKRPIQAASSMKEERKSKEKLTTLLTCTRNKRKENRR